MKLDDKYIKETQKVDQKAKDLYQTSPYRAIKYITDYSVGAGQEAFNTWKELFQYLTIKYIDGNIKKEKDGEFLTNGTGVVVGPEQPGYPESWYRRIVEETGDQFLMLDQENLPEKKEQAAMVTISKTNMNIMIGAIVILGLIVLVMLFRKRK
jgi:hypothetical protein